MGVQLAPGIDLDDDWIERVTVISLKMAYQQVASEQPKQPFALMTQDGGVHPKVKEAQKKILDGWFDQVIHHKLVS